MTQIFESNRWGNDEEKGRNGRKNSEGFGEILRSFHLGNKGGEEDLGDPKKCDIQDGIHASDPGGARERKSIGPDQPNTGVVAVISVEGSVFDARKDEEEEDWIPMQAAVKQKR